MRAWIHVLDVPGCYECVAGAERKSALQGSYQGLFIIFQMDWKRYIITLAKILQSSLQPEVYPEMSDSTVLGCHDIQYGHLALH